MDLGSQPVGWAISSELLPGGRTSVILGLKFAGNRSFVARLEIYQVFVVCTTYLLF